MLIASEIIAERRNELKEQRLNRMVNIICWSVLVLCVLGMAVSVLQHVG